MKIGNKFFWVQSLEFFNLDFTWSTTEKKERKDFYGSMREALRESSGKVDYFLLHKSKYFPCFLFCFTAINIIGFFQPLFLDLLLSRCLI